MNQFQVWKDRVLRIQAKAFIAKNDAARALNWYIGNGRKYFEQNSQDIISAHKWCFIVGCNNSGTSLLQAILEASGQVSTFPHEGQRYTKVIKRAYKRGHERVWTEYLHELRLTQGDSKVCVPRLIHDWMLSMERPFNEIIVEKTTANAVRMTWLQKVFPNSYFIGVVRNAYAVTEGIRRKGKKSVERGAHHWNLVNKIMVNDAKLVDNFITIRYEDVVEKPQESLHNIANFIGLDIDDFKMEMRQHIRNFNSESISRLSKSDIETIQSIAEEMLEYYGYSESLE